MRLWESYEVAKLEGATATLDTGSAADDERTVRDLQRRQDL